MEKRVVNKWTDTFCLLIMVGVKTVVLSK